MQFEQLNSLFRRQRHRDVREEGPGVSGQPLLPTRRVGSLGAARLDFGGGRQKLETTLA